MNKTKLIAALLAAALILPAAHSQAVQANKRSVIERINDKLEKSRRVRESKKRQRELEKRQKQQAEKERAEKPAGTPKP
ncbi:hypothetical protein [Neisseria dentiae]|uniref:hypothetical protein n=1 Tax=Neisseria dentiae TaxID=194197 RepID=UPI00211BE750|nr:hypothetical protein [Neisseria dentiae]MCQ9326481.1 hypothetical protein [Neisseria dentiae]